MSLQLNVSVEPSWRSGIYSHMNKLTMALIFGGLITLVVSLLGLLPV